jgi:prepilin-type N-terminal cleavage/methylation domain-containing protein
MQTISSRIKGFTLIEMIVVMVITGIVTAISATMISASFNSYFTGVNVTTLNNQASIAMLRISKELQQATKFTAINATNTTFTTTGGSTITYSWTTPTLTRTGTSAQAVNNQVTSFALTYYQSSFATTASLTLVRAVTISMTLSNQNDSVSLINTVFLNNMS